MRRVRAARWFLVASTLALIGAGVYRWGVLRDMSGEGSEGVPVVASPTITGDAVRAGLALAPNDPSMPGPAPRAAAGRLGLDNASCEACHAVQAAQWRGSQHQTAYSELEFQRALAREPMPFCRKCHAPEADPRRAPPPVAAEIGVGCVTCHVVGDAVLAGPGPEVRAPHPVRREPRLVAADACVNCHQFGFPDNRRRPVPEAMQRTIAEHAASPGAATACVDCHMRDAAGARTHAFVGSRDPAYMRGALDVAAAWVDAQRVEVRVAARAEAVAHAVPTGDLFRRLTVSVRPGGPGPRRAWSSRYLARHYAVQGAGGPPVRVELSDDRPHAGGPAQVVAFAIDAEDVGRPVAWEVRYERVESLIEEREDRAVVVGGFVIAGGELPPAQKNTRDSK